MITTELTFPPQITIDPAADEGVIDIDADGNVAFNTDVLFIEAALKRLGVGTDDPQAALHVIGDSVFIESGGDSTVRYRLGSTSKWSAGNRSSDDAYVISTGFSLGTPQVEVSSAGAVKILNLAGAGSRTVVVDVNGVLSAP